MWWKSWEKRENALLEKISKSYFQPFFLIKLSQSNPILGFYNKKAKKCSLHIFEIRSKNEFLQKKLKLSKQKNFWKFSLFFFTVYRMRHAIVGGNFMQIFLLKIGKNECNYTVVTRCRQRVNKTGRVMRLLWVEMEVIHIV